MGDASTRPFRPRSCPDRPERCGDAPKIGASSRFCRLREAGFRRISSRAGYGRTMPHPSVPGRHIEIFFNDANRTIDVECEDQDPAIASVVIDAIERDDPDDAEQILRDGVIGTVSRRP